MSEVPLYSQTPSNQAQLAIRDLGFGIRDSGFEIRS